MLPELLRAPKLISCRRFDIRNKSIAGPGFRSHLAHCLLLKISAATAPTDKFRRLRSVRPRRRPAAAG
jgi:hypothetical protein